MEIGYIIGLAVGAVLMLIGVGLILANKRDTPYRGENEAAAFALLVLSCLFGGALAIVFTGLYYIARH